MNVQEYLKKPYSRLVIPEDDGSYRAEIVEFPGCIALADTGPEALQQLEEVAASWLQAAIANGQAIPEPIESTEFSGKFVVRFSKSLHAKAAYVAKREGVSLNQFVVNCVAEQIGAARTNAPHVQTLVLEASTAHPASSWSPLGTGFAGSDYGDVVSAGLIYRAKLLAR